jgi:uncharacterized repeat protein (TIGR04052 family)
MLTKEQNIMKKIQLSIAAIALTSLLGACSDSDNDDTTDTTQTVDAVVDFSAKVGAQNFSSGTTYSGFGAGSSSATQEITLNDLRLYISNIILKTDTNEEIPFTLEQDGVWQYEDIVLLDFETAATPETNTDVIGSFSEPDSGTINQVCFDVGIPFEFNHLNSSTSPSPLNASGMMWKWQSGHKFIRIDGVGDPNGSAVGYNLHLGSTGCVSGSATESPTSACTYPNLPNVCLTSFDLDTNEIVIDLATLFETTDITQVTANTAPGCMSGNNDPECQTLLPKLGLDFVYNDGVNPAQTYTAETQAMFGVDDI